MVTDTLEENNNDERHWSLSIDIHDYDALVNDFGETLMEIIMDFLEIEDPYLQLTMEYSGLFPSEDSFSEGVNYEWNEQWEIPKDGWEPALVLKELEREIPMGMGQFTFGTLNGKKVVFWQDASPLAPMWKKE